MQCAGWGEGRPWPSWLGALGALLPVPKALSEVNSEMQELLNCESDE